MPTSLLIVIGLLSLTVQSIAMIGQDRGVVASILFVITMNLFMSGLLYAAVGRHGKSFWISGLNTSTRAGLISILRMCLLVAALSYTWDAWIAPYLWDEPAVVEFDMLTGMGATFVFTDVVAEIVNRRPPHKLRHKSIPHEEAT